MELETIASKTILVVEDYADIRYLVSRYLAKKGYQVLQAFNGDHALELLKSSILPDLILLDLMMPIKDGFEFRSEQRQHPIWNQILPCRDVCQPQHRREKKRVGVEDYLSNSVDQNRLLDVIKKHLA